MVSKEMTMTFGFSTPCRAHERRTRLAGSDAARYARIARATMAATDATSSTPSSEFRILDLMAGGPAGVSWSVILREHKFSIRTYLTSFNMSAARAGLSKDPRDHR